MNFTQQQLREATLPEGYDIPIFEVQIPNGSCWFEARKDGILANIYHYSGGSRGVTPRFLKRTPWGYKDDFGNTFETLNQFLAFMSDPDTPVKPIPVFYQEAKKYAVLVRGMTHKFLVSQIVNRDKTISWVLSRSTSTNLEKMVYKATSCDGINWFVDAEHSHVFKTLDELKSFLNILGKLKSYYFTSLENHKANPVDRTKPLSL